MDNEITNGLIERGNAAEQLLQSGAFQMAANALMDMYVGDILRPPLRTPFPEKWVMPMPAQFRTSLAF